MFCIPKGYSAVGSVTKAHSLSYTEDDTFIWISYRLHTGTFSLK